MNETLVSILVEKLIAKDILEKEIAEIKLAIELELGEEGFKNDSITISRSKASESTSIDLKALEKAEPELYADLLKDYTKVTKRSGSVSYKLNKSKE